MKIHLGCGKRFLKGYYHVDCQRYPHVDHVSQINKLDFLEDNRANEIYISHAFEYFDDAEAKEVLKEFGITLDDEIEIKVWDSNADIRYLVLPQRPNGTEKLNEIELEKLVTRNSMIGTEILTYNAKK